MSELAKKERDITFDVMKGIGILLVLLGHVWGIPTINHIITSFHMPMFFIVAGYFSKSYSSGISIIETTKHYAKRLIPPYLVTMVAICVWSAMKAYLNGGWNVVICKILSILWADVNALHTPYGNLGIGVVWFLLALFWAKTLLLIISRWEKWVLPLSLMISIAAWLLHKVFPYSVACISLGCIALPFLAVGWWVKRHPLHWALKLIMLLAWGAAILWSELDMYEYRWGCYPLDLLGACGGAYCVYVVSKWIAKAKDHKVVTYSPRVLAYLGTISLAIMCVHCFEIDSHLGNHLRAAIGWEMSLYPLYVWRYALTIVLAIVLTKIPKVKSLFV